MVMHGQVPVEVEQQLSAHLGVAASADSMAAGDNEIDRRANDMVVASRSMEPLCFCRADLGLHPALGY